MGKGTIISHIADGQYSLRVNYFKEQYEAKIAVLDTNIALLTTQIDTVLQAGTKEYNIAKLQRTALEKEKYRLESQFPDDKTIQAWCGDLTEDLSGEVSTIEVPGESTAIQIAPGFEGKAAYSSANSGQLVPTIAQGAAQAFYNLAMLPGWQKWKPLFRYATITEKTGDTADVALDTARSSQQNLNINQESILSAVAIEYMDCNGAAFNVGDEVLIKFTGQDWSAPKIVGFKDNPKPCSKYVLITANATGYSEYCIVWDIVGNCYNNGVTTNNGGIANFPILTSDISDWIDAKVSDGNPVISIEPDGTNKVVYLPTPEPSYPDDYMEVTGENGCYPSSRCWIITDGSFNSYAIEGIDYLGNAGQEVFRTANITFREREIGTATYDSEKTYDSNVRGNRANGYILTPLTTGVPRARTAAAELTLSRHDITCYGNVQWPCDTYGDPTGKARGLIDISTVTEFDFISPFLGHLSKTCDHLDKSYSKWDSGCEYYTEFERFSGQLYDVKGSMSGKTMVVFYVEELITKHTHYPCSVNFDERGERCDDTSTVYCTDPAEDVVYTYYHEIDFTVKAFSHVIPDNSDDVLEDINPFEISENSDLSAAILSLKNSLGETPAEGNCSGVVFEIDIVK